MPKVLSKRTATPAQLANAVYVGRPSKWGNPYFIGLDGTREQVIEKYRRSQVGRPPDHFAELRGKDLVCWCAPLPCHADVLLELANGPETRSPSHRSPRAAGHLPPPDLPPPGRGSPGG